MRFVKSFVVLLALMLAVGVVAIAEEKPAVAEAGADKAAAKADADKPAGKKVRLTKPWSGLDSLTDDQKQKIADIHAKAIAEIKAIEQRERDEIMALLTSEQKAQVEDLAAQDKAKRKSKGDGKSANEGEEADAGKTDDATGM